MECDGGFSGDYGYSIRLFTLACLYRFLGCYEVGIYILGQSSNLRVEVGSTPPGWREPSGHDQFMYRGLHKDQAPFRSYL